MPNLHMTTDRIIQDPAILAGKPVVRGARIPVHVVLEYLASNPSLDELFADYPRLTILDVKASFAFAQILVEAVPRPIAAIASAAPVTPPVPVARHAPRTKSLYVPLHATAAPSTMLAISPASSVAG